MSTSFTEIRQINNYMSRCTSPAFALNAGDTRVQGEVGDWGALGSIYCTFFCALICFILEHVPRGKKGDFYPRRQKTGYASTYLLEIIILLIYKKNARTILLFFLFQSTQRRYYSIVMHTMDKVRDLLCT